MWYAFHEWPGWGGCNYRNVLQRLDNAAIDDVISSRIIQSTMAEEI